MLCICINKRQSIITLFVTPANEHGISVAVLERHSTNHCQLPARMPGGRGGLASVPDAHNDSRCSDNYCDIVGLCQQYTASLTDLISESGTPAAPHPRHVGVDGVNIASDVRSLTDVAMAPAIAVMPRSRSHWGGYATLCGTHFSAM